MPMGDGINSVPLLLRNCRTDQHEIWTIDYVRKTVLFYSMALLGRLLQ